MLMKVSNNKDSSFRVVFSVNKLQIAPYVTAHDQEKKQPTFGDQDKALILLGIEKTVNL